MTADLEFLDGSRAHLIAVESVRRAGLTRFQVQCFGNGPVFHNDVARLTVGFDVTTDDTAKDDILGRRRDD